MCTWETFLEKRKAYVAAERERRKALELAADKAEAEAAARRREWASIAPGVAEHEPAITYEEHADQVTMTLAQFRALTGK